ncbi:MAG: DUF4386 family protein [Acidimicrobiales bacterium]
MSERTTYEIVLRGRPSDRLLQPLADDFAVVRACDGELTHLVGGVADPAHLHGLVAHLTSVNLEIVSIAPFTPRKAPAMTTTVQSPKEPAGASTTAAGIGRPVGHWEGRLFGGLVLAAFGLYGIGSSVADQPIGLLLVAANSVAVAVVGLLGHRLVRDRHPRVGAIYLGARLTEAILLAGGIFLHELADVADADNTGYLLAMIALGAGSLPFWHVVGRGPWLANRLALWGIAGYLSLASGALLELATGRELTVIAAIPGGLFEAILGLYLVVRGFGTSTRREGRVR